jgi:hypothetical protein
MIIGFNHYSIIIALNPFTCIYNFSNCGNNNIDTNGKMNIIKAKYNMK